MENEVNVNEQDSQVETVEEEQSNDTEKTFTQDEVNKIVQKRINKELEKERSEREEAVKEAEKLAKMNAQQKKDYEFEKLQQELAELRAENNKNAMKSEATKMFKEQNVEFNDGILNFVVAENADDTKANVEAYSTMFKETLAKAIDAHFKSNGREVGNPNTESVTSRTNHSIAEMARNARIIK